MAKHKSPFTEEIYLVWDQLVLEKGANLSMEERVEGWKKLHEMCWNGHEWTVGYLDAGLSGNLGISLALQQARHQDALRLSQELLAHPESRKYRKDSSTRQVLGYEVVSLIFCGEVDLGIEKSLAAIDSKQFGRGTRIFTLCCLGNLSAILFEQGLESNIDPRLRDYAIELIRRFPGFKKDEELVTKMATHREVYEWVETVYRRNLKRRARKNETRQNRKNPHP